MIRHGVLKNKIHSMSEAQRAHVLTVMYDLEKLNASVRKAVDSGLTIELERASRHHCGQGHWGDVMKPNFVKQA